MNHKSMTLRQHAPPPHLPLYFILHMLDRLDLGSNLVLHGAKETADTEINVDFLMINQDCQLPQAMLPWIMRG
jgi:hypothetical protein